MMYFRYILLIYSEINMNVMTSDYPELSEWFQVRLVFLPESFNTNI